MDNTHNPDLTKSQKTDMKRGIRAQLKVYYSITNVLAHFLIIHESKDNTMKMFQIFGFLYICTPCVCENKVKSRVSTYGRDAS